jgi:ribosomal protein S18 acetylase RimI-like enzyme
MRAGESIGGRPPTARAKVQGVVSVTRRGPGERLQFRPIDVERDGALSVAFRRDSYVCSFGSDALFVEENGADGRGYLEWLRDRVIHFPDGHVHAWRGPDIVGQIEMVIGPTSGYINLFYLRPDARGQGLGEQLHAYAVALLQRRGVRVAGLSVSPTNDRALRYYERHGWRDLGARAGADHVHEMVLVVPPASPATPG